MILVLAGTRDGREIASLLADAGYKILVSVVSEYGGALIQHPRVKVHVGALDEAGIRDLIQRHGVRYLVDASHPYAAGVSVTAMQAAGGTGVSYLRYERPATPLPKYDRLRLATDARQAAQMAGQLGKAVFLTTGSRTLKVFKDEPALRQCRLIARILPEPGVMAECIALGFSPQDIIAAQGPFSLDLNAAMFRFYQADVMVTKNGGAVGGADSKMEAAMQLGMHIVVIDRPKVEYPNSFCSIDDVLTYFKEAVTCSI